MRKRIRNSNNRTPNGEPQRRKKPPRDVRQMCKHSTRLVRTTPTQMMFGTDTTFTVEVQFQANRHYIAPAGLKESRNMNAGKRTRQHRVGHKGFVRDEQSRKYGTRPYSGPM